MEINVILPGNCLEHCVACFEIEMFSISFISKDSRSLKAFCQIFVQRLMPLGQPISHSIEVYPRIEFTCLTWHTVLLPGTWTLSRSWQHFEFWQFQICDWSERVLLFGNLSK
jgi:hypothetical protein